MILAACIEFLVGNLSVDPGVRDVDLDDVAFLQQADVAARSSFRANVSDGGAAACAAESAVRDQSNRLVQLHAGESTGRVEHFPHSRTALRAFVADDNNVAVHDLAGVDGFDGVFFAVEYSGRTGVGKHFRCYGASLDHAAILCDVAPHNGDAACFAVWFVDRTDDVVVFYVRSCKVFAHGFSCCRDKVFVDEAFLVQFTEHCHQTACTVQIVHVSAAGRSQVAEVWNFGAEFVEDVQVKMYACFVGDGQQVEYAVGGAAQSHIAGQSVAQGLFVDDIPRLDVLFHQVHDSHSGVFCQTDPSAVHCRDRTVSRQGDADCFGETVHAVCRIHAGAGSAARAYVLFEFQKIIIIDDIGFSRANCFKHLGKAGFFAFYKTGHHRTSGADNGRDIHANSCHDHARYDLVAVWNQYKTIECVSHGHGFHTVCDQLSAWETVFHADMAHSDAVADADRRYFDRCTASHADAGLYGFSYFIQVHMTRYDFTLSGNDTDQRPFQLFLRISHRVEQTPHRSTFYALGYFITSHFHFPFRSGDFPETLYFVLIRKKRRRKRRRHFPSFKFIKP